MIYHRKFIHSFGYAWSGLKHALHENQNLRIHFIVAFIVAILSIIFGLDEFEMGILGVVILVVIAAEMINTSIEEMVNLITKEHRQEAKIAKDVSAGMVLVTAIGSVIVGILIFIPHIIRFLK
jgi:diacylglycerol kinase